MSDGSFYVLSPVLYPLPMMSITRHNGSEEK
jgi:hypothetical protein